jgi:Sulfotransferase family
VTPDLNYSRLDRLVHRVAFLAPFVQLTAADLEKTLWRASYADVRADRPIFITSLPRAGTTLMLEALNHLPSLAAQTYRDMPFVMAPLFWSRLSAPFRQRQEIKERAHGDGVAIGFDSPEAFEEVIWRTFWPAKYSKTGIERWSVEDDRPEAHAFLVEHMQKVIALRRSDRPKAGRYLSKNNGNIARLDLLRRMFPGAKVLLVVRRPLDHARSLLQQHRRFLEMHRQAPFVRRYMADIGHYEFGALHRPIQFPELASLTTHKDPLTLDYWLAYWIAAFESPIRDRGNLRIVSYEDTCAHPASALTALCGWLDVDPEGVLPRVAALFREAPPSDRPDPDADPELVERADGIHRTLIRAV